MGLKKLGNIYKSKGQAGQIYDPKGISPTLVPAKRGGKAAMPIIYDPYNKKVPKNQKHSTALRTNWMDGNAWVIPKSTNTRSKSTRGTSQNAKTMEMQEELFPKSFPTLTCLLSDGLAKTIALLENAKDKRRIHEAVYCLRRLGSFGLKSPSISLLKMSKDYSASMKAVTSTQQLKCSPTLGMIVNGKFLIQAGFSPRIESGYTLSDILEEHPDQKYFLSERQTRHIQKVMRGEAKFHQQDKVHNPAMDRPNIPAGTHGSTPHLLKIWQPASTPTTERGGSTTGRGR